MVPLGQLVLIVLAVLAASGHGRGILLQFRLSGAAAAVLLAAAAFGGRFTWTAPLVPPVVFDFGSAALLGGTVVAGIRPAYARGRAALGYFVLTTLVTTLLVLVLHGYVPQEPGAVLDARTGLLLASGLISAGIARSPSAACSAAAVAYVAIIARDWLLMHRGGYTAVPLSVGGYGMDMLVLGLVTAALAARLLAVASAKTGSAAHPTVPIRRGGGTA